ncbi:SCO6745 family protein [Actinophytocola glycyrrhizae]|uniref:SalK n=1 Tax=Actinophytocola glycyrrhizae TaxID=2044873 RepID=A0ABV9SBI5_9PSEU
MSVDLGLVRQLWRLAEPVHAIGYYAPEVSARFAKLGFDTAARWPSYFPLRAAPLGAVGPELVAATFYSFDPAMVREHIPAAWQVATPDDVLAARRDGIDEALGRLTADVDLREAVDLAHRLVDGARTVGRPLGAANADLPWPDEPHLALWHAVTVLREVRGDGHVAALLTAGLDPVESLVSFAGVGAAPKEVFASRGWSEDEWAAATGRLVERGWLNEDGTATEAGRDGRDEVERMTDELAAPAYRALGAERAGRFAQLVMPVTMAVVQTGLLPRQSTLGLSR